jgi:CRISPR-associated endoribonuclease Cas6
VRVKLTLASTKRAARLPLDYQYALASLIYATLGDASAAFSARLHDEGFRIEKRRFKLFTFSRLRPEGSQVIKDYLLLKDPQVSFQLSSPVADFIEHFVTGLFQRETFTIAGADFKLASAETLAPPAFSERMSFRALSPVTETTNEEGQKHARYLSLTDDWSRIIQQNLIHKYQALHGHAPADDRLQWTWDQAYIAEAEKRGRRLSVLTDIHGIKVRGWLAPFTVEGSPELIEMGYEAGYGSRNSMGFGMAESI